MLPEVLRDQLGRKLYRFLDRFTTDQAAPLPSPRTCEPGPGSFTVVQTDGQFGISGGKLAFPAQGTPVWGDLGLAGQVAISPRRPGWAVLSRVNVGATTTYVKPVVWGRNTTLENDTGTSLAATLYLGSGQVVGVVFSSQSGVSKYTQSTLADYLASTDYDVALVTRSAGYWFLMKAAADSQWQLCFVEHGTNWVSPLYPQFSNYNATGTLDNFRVVSLSGIWADDWGPATQRLATAGAGATLTHTADGILYIVITAQTGVTQELRFRWTDDNNCWIVRMDQAGGTIKLVERNAGVETERSSNSQTWANGTQYGVIVMFWGQKVRVSVSGIDKIVYTAASFNQTATTAKTSHGGSNFVSWPRFVTLPNV